MRRLIRLAFIIAAAVVMGLVISGWIRDAFLSPGDIEGVGTGVSRGDLSGQELEVVATGLEVPWEIRFLPGGDLLVTERPGRLVRLSPAGEVVVSHVVPDVASRGEAGLMGLALHPDFAANGWLYVCFTTGLEGGLTNRVERLRWDDAGLSERTAILTGMPGARFHDGCRIDFGPDGYLYVTMGDAGDRAAAQDTASLSGKILRITEEGAPAPGNPFGNRVWSYGHRNPQGLTWDGDRLWSTEHGPSGGGSGFDEVNRIVAGRNYGWPLVQGDETRAGLTSPVAHSGPNATWAPGGAAWLDGSVFFGGLRGQALYEARIVDAAGTSPSAVVVPHFYGEYGRIRAVRVGPDGWIWFGTSNRDGRGRVRRGDDRIIRVDPAALRREGP